MTTSLSEQLSRLKAPQTDLLLQDKTRPSLLFDPKEAANLDRNTVLSIGQSGLEQLVKLSPLFADFKETLFAKNSLNLERAVQSTVVNKALNTEIEKFLILLSPYFLLNASHKALEWLIYRYRIHEYNRDQFIMLILAYHESRIFARAVQLLDLSDESNKWHWLASLQKSGLPQISKTLVDRLSTDNGLLKMLCTHIISAVEIHSNHASELTTLFAFYTTLVLGLIEQTTITEVQINHLLPTILYGLKSPVLDFAASSYIIIAQLTTKVKFDDETMEKILLRIFKKTHLKQEAVTLLLYLYQSPFNRLTAIPHNVVLKLSNLSWFIETVSQIHSSSINASRFAVPLLQAACQAIVEDPQAVSVQNMMNDFLTHVKLDNDSVDMILSNVLTCKFYRSDMPKDVKEFIAQFYQKFERSYPDRFDRYLKHLTEQDNKDTDSKQALDFLTSWPFVTNETQESVQILDKLAHFNPAQRVRALEILAESNVSVPKSFRSMMTKTLQARFHDADVNVVKTLLCVPVSKLTSLLPTDTLVNDLVTLLSTCHTASRKELAKPALKVLLELCEDGTDTKVFISALPYLFPATEKDVEVTMEVLHSNFAKNNIYMQYMTSDLEKSSLTAEIISATAFHNILNYQLLPATNKILNSIRQQISHGDAASLFFNMILLGSVCRVPVGSMPARMAREVIEIATDMIKKYPRINLLHDCNIITGDNIQAALKLTSEGTLPLQVGTYVLEMVHRRLDLKSEPKLDFIDNAEQSNLTVRLLEMFFEGMSNKQWKKHYSRCLQIFFQRHFATMKDLISFLSQLYVKPVRVQTSYHCLQITLQLLDHCSTQWVFQDQYFVTNLLLSLARSNNACRLASIDILKKLTQTFNLSKEPLSVLLHEVAARSSEIAQDSDQLSLMLYFILSPDPDVSSQMKQRKKLQQAQKLLFDVVLQKEIPMDRRSQLLNVLAHVNGTEILQQLVPLGLKLLRQLANQSRRNRPAGSALRNILERFNDSTVEVLNDSQVWSFFEASILQYDSYAVTESDEEISPSIVLLKQINQAFFARAGKISRDLQAKIFAKMLDVLTDCEVSKVISNANRVIRRISIDASLVVSELQTMKQSKPEEQPDQNSKKKPKRHSQTYLLANPKMVYSKAWKRGETLLQIVQHANNIENEQTLYGVLFELMNVCVSLEELSPVEYTNQLILQTIHRLMTQGLPLRDPGLYISLITKCIRTSRNPQTHHHALQVLVELLKKVDVNRAFINIMPIFTFMGSTVVRQDDSYSIQITSKVLETVVPIINAADKESHACVMLRIFVTSLPDIPEHRRTPLFAKLLQLLDKYLHLYYLITFESHAMKLNTKLANESAAAQRLEFALQLCQEFPPQQLLQVCMKVVDFIKILPVDIEEEQDKRAAINFPYNHVYDVSKSTPKILRHYKLTAVQFLSSLLSSQDFINRASQLSADDAMEMNEYCDSLGAELIMLIQSISKVSDQDQNKPSSKYWKVLLHHLYDVLDLVNNLLPNTMFLKNVKRLQTTHVHLSVRKKILELLNVRLSQKKFSKDDHLDLLNLIEHLMGFINVEEVNESQEYEVVQQMALVSVKLLARLLATDHPEVFKPILQLTIELMRSKDGPVLANAALCVAELVCSMKTFALSLLNKFMPAILKLLKTHCHQNVPDTTVVSIVSALQKIVESLGNFLSSYLSELLFELTRLNSLYTDIEHPKTGVVVSRLKMITQKISNYTSLRVLLPTVSKTYDVLLKKKFYHRIPSLMGVLGDCFESMPSAKMDITSLGLTEFFLKVLEFRENVEGDSESGEMGIDVEDAAKDIVAVEASASKAFVALVLKLSEANFKPLYQDIYKWAEKSTKHKERNVTFYRLSANIAECLKSLFALFAGIFLKHSALLLKTNNMFVNDVHELTLPEESSRVELVEAILLTLQRVFRYDAHNFVNQERFEILAQPLVEQMENTMGAEEEYESRASQLIVPCIASFASAIPDDALHKQLVCQTLLKTKHTKPYVRRTALNALVEIARKLGEDFMPLLPETMPFLSEILEDEDETTEKCAQNAICALEEILGEPLQKYF